MGIARYRDAKTGELIPDLSKHKGEYVVERPWGSDWGGDPIWPDQKPVMLQLTQQEAKQLQEFIHDNPQMKEITNSIERQIWKYRREDYV